MTAVNLISLIAHQMIFLNKKNSTPSCSSNSNNTIGFTRTYNNKYNIKCTNRRNSDSNTTKTKTSASTTSKMNSNDIRATATKPKTTQIKLIPIQDDPSSFANVQSYQSLHVSMNTSIEFTSQTNFWYCYTYDTRSN
jgi:hypothetical protein